MTTLVDHRHDAGSSARATPNGAGASLLCISNYPANTGFAWNFIEELYADLADRLAAGGVRTWVGYPAMAESPRPLNGSAARPVELGFDLTSWKGIRSAMRFISRERVRVIYLSDRDPWHPAYPLLRLAGLRRLIVQDHTSGARTRPRGIWRSAKWLSRRFPGFVADEVIAVSDYVARRKLEVDLIPPDRVRRVWNSVRPAAPQPDARRRLHDRFGIADGRPIVMCTCRAAPEKGVDHLLRAFDDMPRQAGAARPVLVYLGDGPMLPELGALRAGLRFADDVILGGYCADAPDLVAGAELCVVPSTWEEAFGLAALEPMRHGVAVIASRTGGIPEIVRHDETGLLVPPGDEAALRDAIVQLLSDPIKRQRLGASGRHVAAIEFSRSTAVDQLVTLMRPGFE